MAQSFMDGNEAIAHAAILAGCRFFAGYPITPATTIYQHMLRFLPPIDGICLQGEDEISSIGMCLGAAMAGMQVMTATSGPGISLFSEHISFAVGSEIPIVIINVQRLGPSTGSATCGADGDIQFLRWGCSGGLPVIVLAPVDVRDCFEMTLHAFNLAEQYRCPVFVATNKEIGMTRESIDPMTLTPPSPLQRRYCPPGQNFLPFQAGPGQMVPDFLPMGGDRLVRHTSSTHGADGYITVDPQIIATTLDRLQQKLTATVQDFTFYQLDQAQDPDTLLIVYGVTARAAETALTELRDKGCRVSLLVLKTLYPVPVQLIQQCIDTVNRVMVVEMNLGQYVREIERLAGTIEVEHFGQMNGEIITPQQIVEVLA